MSNRNSAPTFGRGIQVDWFSHDNNKKKKQEQAHDKLSLTYRLIRSHTVAIVLAVTRMPSTDNNTMSPATEGAHKFLCPFDGCTEILPTDRSLRAHLRAHRSSTPVKCEHAPCSKLFGTISERNDHQRHDHMPAKVDDAVAVAVGEKITAQLGGDDGRFDDSMILTSTSISGTAKTKAIGSSMTDKKEEEEAADMYDNDMREIGDNAAYLVSQLRDAWVSFYF